jgi:hypothetical protein
VVVLSDRLRIGPGLRAFPPKRNHRYAFNRNMRSGERRSCAFLAPCRRRAWHSHHDQQTIRGDAVGQGKSERDFRGVFALRHGGHASNISRMVGMPENYESRLAATLW